MPNGRVVGLLIPGGGSMPRSEIDACDQFVRIYGAKGLAYIKVNDKAAGRDGLQSAYREELARCSLGANLRTYWCQKRRFDFLRCRQSKIVNDAIGALRVKVGHSEFGKANGLFEDIWKPLWVIDFPMFEHDEENDRWTAVHHPFTAPKDGHEDLMESDRASVSRRPTTWS